jgi:AcrR family transcriptional regulator
VCAVSAAVAKAAGGELRARQSARLAEIQRARLMSGAIGVLDEHGYARTTVAHITNRARVSRRTFYELFANREECMLAVLDDTCARIAAALESSEIERLAWRERVRVGLATILTFFDSEPALARVCLSQALRGGPRVIERRERILGQLAAVLDEGRRQGARGREHGPLIAEGLVGATFAIVHARVQHQQREPLVGLLGELMSLIVLPYLGPAVARREQQRQAPPAVMDIRSRAAASEPAAADPLRDVPMRLTYRTARVLEGVGEHPGASNRVIGEYAGITDQGQISKLLARLERLELLAKSGAGHAKGEPNAWLLTARGAQVAQSIRLHAPVPRRQRRAA